MAAYFQMGHHSENLVGEKGLEIFNGILLSPVNRLPVELAGDIEKFRDRGDYDIVLDTQLYVPRSERGQLPSQPYFPDDFETADLSGKAWWNAINKEIYDYCNFLQPSSVATPVCIPNRWTDGYYKSVAETSYNLYKKFSKSPIRVYTTVLINTKELTASDQIYKIASILTSIPTDGYYIVFMNDTEPRREIADESQLFGIMQLIKELSNVDLPIIVGYCSSCMLLLKAAGATHCATGKFFNLRRFTKSRWEEPSSGGTPMSYWFEQGLLAFLREPDLLRLMREGFGDIVGTGKSDNLWSKKILKHLETEPDKAWMGLGWRQYLNWFCEAENELNSKSRIKTARNWLKNAEENWMDLEDDDVLMDEVRNDGPWVRPWRQALMRFKKSL